MSHGSADYLILKMHVIEAVHHFVCAMSVVLTWAEGLTPSYSAQ